MGFIPTRLGFVVCGLLLGCWFGGRLYMFEYFSSFLLRTSVFDERFSISSELGHLILSESLVVLWLVGRSPAIDTVRGHDSGGVAWGSK